MTPEQINDLINKLQDTGKFISIPGFIVVMEELEKYLQN